jgi:glycosyltransferase involved in cell wall biosynthesis
MPFFSIIIPTYNRSSLLQELLEHFMLQTFTDFELIVIDDGGTDNSEEIVLGFSDSRFRYYKKSNGGVSSARNFGITKAGGQYINFFDSDDLVYPNHLEEARNFFLSNPGSDVVIFDYDWGDRARKKTRLISNRYKDPNRAIRYQNYISTNCIFIERSLTNSLGFNEQLTISEDWQYWIRLSSIARFRTVNISTSCIVEHPGRGINTIDLSSIIAQKDEFIGSLRKDKNIMSLKNFKLNIIVSHFCSLIALNATLAGKKKIALSYFGQSLALHLPSLLSKRSLAIIKHLFFTS